MNNSVFCKSLENIRKISAIKLVMDKKALIKLSSRRTFVTSKIINDDLVAIHKSKERLTLNKPAYVGTCILDISKMLIYDFHYIYIKKEYNDTAKLLFTNTDSLTYEIETEDAYSNFWKDKEKFDNSNYPSL